MTRNTRPHKLGNPNRHFWLVQRMARAAEVDLVRAAREGKLAQADWARMVKHCRGCQWAEGCEKWLAGDETVEIPPLGCVNRHRFAALKNMLAEEDTRADDGLFEDEQSTEAAL